MVRVDRSARLAAQLLLVASCGLAIACGDEEGVWEGAAHPVDADAPGGAWADEADAPGLPGGAAPENLEALARQLAAEIDSLEAAGYLSGTESASASESASGSFTGTLPPEAAGGFPVGFGGGASGFPGGQTASPGGSGYDEPGAFRGEAEVGGVPLVGGTVDESGGGNSVYSVGGMVIELP